MRTISSGVLSKDLYLCLKSLVRVVELESYLSLFLIK